MSFMTRWQRESVARGEDYDERWRILAESGHTIHGEADLVTDLLSATGGHSVLDAGCGTGRVAVELSRRGFAVTGVDADPEMLEPARGKDSRLAWFGADLADPGETAPGPFDLILLAGNVMIFPGGLLVAGFSLQPGRLALADYDDLARAAGLRLLSRWATWDREPFVDADYAVSVHGR
jgi:SAM-dependent methyltransferase